MVKKGRFVFLGILLLGGLIMTGCGSPAKDGDIVQVHYTGTLEDGSQFDSSVGRDPLEFTVGAGQMIAGFDRAVLGMTVGEKKTVTIPAAEAYGEHRDDLVTVENLDLLPSEITPEVGMKLSAGGRVVTVTEVTETTFTIDANHELAGKDLIFEIELVAIK